MGCDMHGWIEVKKDSTYIAIKEQDFDRNYKRFSELAGVRGDGDKLPKGIPTNISETAKYHIEQWGTDGHSHSYMPLTEAVPIFLKTEYELSNHQKECPLNSFFNIYNEDISCLRLVFWFDN